MPITVPCLRIMVGTIGRTTSADFQTLTLADDEAKAITVGDIIGDHLAKLRGAEILISWGDPADTSIGDPPVLGAYTETTNGPADTPFVWAFATGTTFHRLLFLAPTPGGVPNNRKIYGILEIPPGEVPNFTVNSAYYINAVTINLMQGA